MLEIPNGGIMGTKNEAPKVRCAHTKLVDPRELIPNPENPNKHPVKQLQLFAKIMQASGVRRPVTVSNLSGMVVKGHGELAVYLLKGWPQVPVDYQDYDSPEQEVADMAADNRLGKLSQLDKTALKALMKKLRGQSVVDQETSGYFNDEIEDMFREMDSLAPQYPITADLNEKYDYVVIVTKNETDAAYLRNLCGVRKEQSFKNKSIGLGRAVPFDRFMEALRANFNPVNE